MVNSYTEELVLLIAPLLIVSRMFLGTSQSVTSYMGHHFQANPECALGNSVKEIIELLLFSFFNFSQACFGRDVKGNKTALGLLFLFMCAPVPVIKNRNQNNTYLFLISVVDESYQTNGKQRDECSACDPSKSTPYSIKSVLEGDGTVEWRSLPKKRGSVLQEVNITINFPQVCIVVLKPGYFNIPHICGSSVRIYLEE